MKNSFLMAIILSMASNAALGDAHKGHSSHKSHKGEKHQHHHGKHVHGEAELSVAIESKDEIEINLNIPAETLVGFERKPKNDKEKVKVESALNLLKDRLNQILVLPAASICEFKKIEAELDLEDEGGHAEFEVEAKISCKTDPTGEIAKFVWNEDLKKLKKVNVVVVSSKGQKAASLKKGKEEFSL